MDICKNCKPRAVFGTWKPWGLLWGRWIKRDPQFPRPLQSCRPPCPRGLAMCTEQLSSHVALLSVKSTLYNETVKISHFCQSTLASVLKVILLKMLLTDISFSFRLWVAKESMKSRYFPHPALCAKPLSGEPVLRGWPRCHRGQWPLNRSWRQKQESFSPAPWGLVSLNFKELDWESPLSFSCTFRGNWSIRSDYSTNSEPFPSLFVLTGASQSLKG